MELSFSSLTQFCLYLTILVTSLAYSHISHAQVTSDGTANTQVNQNANVAEITGGETRGNNLFHSFQDFSVGNGGEAFFNNAQNIDNILSRVTGGNVSNINGTLRANGSANLFLINPAGIVFGNGARLDLGGSFYGSSASSILFEDGEFSAADLDNPPLLTVNAPIGLGFRDNPGNITVSSSEGLFVSSRETLALVGGDVSFDAGIAGFAISNTVDTNDPGVALEIGGLIETGTIAIEENGSLNFPDNVVRGDVSITNNSFLNTTASEAGSGSVNVNARNFEMNTNSRITNGIFSDSGNVSAQAGNININATENVVLDGEGSVRFPIAERTEVAIRNNVFVSGVGTAGDINISANNISLLNAAEIGTSLANQGGTGNINLNASENILIDSASITNEITEDAQGDVGDINITANTFSNLGNITSNVSGISDSAGEINITAEMFNNSGRIVSEVSGMGNSSDITISVDDDISIAGDSGLIQTRVERDIVGNSGNIEIQASDLSITAFGSGINTENLGRGDGGDVNLTVDTIVVDGSEISTNTDALIIDLISQEESVGNGGDINISTNSLSVINSGQINASVEGDGNGGDINITSRNSVLVDGGTIQSDLGGFFIDSTGNAGNVEINTALLTVTNGAFISASTFSNGNAGNLTISTSESVEVSNDAVVQAEVFDGATGTGGNLTIETANLNVSNGSQISASTRGTGDAGNLNISTTDSINVTGSTETGSSAILANALVEDGDGGELNISTQDLSISDNAVISAGNFPTLAGLREPGTGEAGSLSIQANSINVESGGSIEAATQSSIGDGANINLDVANAITLRDGGSISAEAVEDGNGGNLNIDTNFIVAFPSGNNDIIASAEQGQGGNININAESVFGIQERPLNNSTNDINASSEVLGFDGSINIETLDFNPLQGIIAIVTGIVESEQTTAQACNNNREEIAKQGNSLTVKGQGGIVPAPDLPLNSHNALIDGKTDAPLINSTPKSVSTSLGNIVPARGVKVAKNGQVRLTAHAINSKQRGYKGSRNCGVLY